ncbi:MAG: hypothetical protein PHT12_01825 [Patescibacteria group bacterium]|nr:hypothetical protein [Patescibacteria group bacterium]
MTDKHHRRQRPDATREPGRGAEHGPEGEERLPDLEAALLEVMAEQGHDETESGAAAAAVLSTADRVEEVVRELNVDLLPVERTAIDEARLGAAGMPGAERGETDALVAAAREAARGAAPVPGGSETAGAAPVPTEKESGGPEIGREGAPGPSVEAVFDRLSAILERMEGAEAAKSEAAPASPEIEELKRQLAEMNRRFDELSRQLEAVAAARPDVAPAGPDAGPRTRFDFGASPTPPDTGRAVTPPSDRLAEAGDRVADLEASLRRYHGVVGWMRGLGTGGRVMKMWLTEESERAKREYREARAEFVGDNVTRMLDERERQVEARREAWLKKKGWEKKLGEKLYGWHQKLGDWNALNLGKKFGWEPKSRIGKFAMRSVSVRNAITAGLLGVGFGLGAMSAVGGGAILMRRGMAGFGAGVGSYDVMKRISEARRRKKMEGKDVSVLSREQIVELMEHHEATALVDGRSLVGNDEYQALRQRLEQLEGEKVLSVFPDGVDNYLNDAMHVADFRMEKVRSRYQLSDDRMKKVAVGIGAFVGSGLFARVAHAGTVAAGEKVGLIDHSAEPIHGQPSAPEHAAIVHEPPPAPATAPPITEIKPLPEYEEARLAAEAAQGDTTAEATAAAEVGHDQAAAETASTTATAAKGAGKALRSVVLERGQGAEGQWQASVILDSRGQPSGYAIDAVRLPDHQVASHYLADHNEQARHLVASRNLDELTSGKQGAGVRKALANVYERQRLLDEMDGRGYGDSPLAGKLRAEISDKLAVIERMTSGKAVSFRMPDGLDHSGADYNNAQYDAISRYADTFDTRGVTRGSLEQLAYGDQHGPVTLTDAGGRQFSVDGSQVEARAAALRELNAMRSDVAHHAGGRFSYDGHGRVTSFSPADKFDPYAMLKPRWTADLRAANVPWERVEEAGRVAKEVAAGRKSLALLEAAGDGQSPEAAYLRSALEQHNMRLAQLTGKVDVFRHDVASAADTSRVVTAEAGPKVAPEHQAYPEARPAVGDAPVRFNYDSHGNVTGFRTTLAAKADFHSVLRPDYIQKIQAAGGGVAMRMKAEQAAGSLATMEKTMQSLQSGGFADSREARILGNLIRHTRGVIKKRYGEVLS